MERRKFVENEFRRITGIGKNRIRTAKARRRGAGLYWLFKIILYGNAGIYYDLPDDGYDSEPHFRKRAGISDGSVPVWGKCVLCGTGNVDTAS